VEYLLSEFRYRQRSEAVCKRKAVGIDSKFGDRGGPIANGSEVGEIVSRTGAALDMVHVYVKRG